ncbi:chorismate synthase [Aminiphilus sp.]|uniref:chorismate synthase n=1 Tax=Aminiphilus sp. TaxID=1872488 RepID=UPI002621C694|nr:chorismate synthase [Aminiphilus sp.]
MTLRFLTSGESHGRGLLVVVEGLPAGLALALEDLEGELARRRRGYGRGPRMALERDAVQVWGGLRNGRTTGAPVGLSLDNAEAALWEAALGPWHNDPEAAGVRRITAPRPGHADLAGAVKYGHEEFRNVLERASARTTAPRTLAGALARRLLAELDVDVAGAVEAIGGVLVRLPEDDEGWRTARNSSLGCAFPEDEKAVEERIRAAKEAGDSLGGTFVVALRNVPAGIGSGVEWDRRLDGRFGAALLAVPGIKGVEIGDGFAAAGAEGSAVHDEIIVRDGRWERLSNRAGGIEGGMTNGCEVVLRAAMKPIPTLVKPLRSYDVETKKPASAHAERSDVCAVPAACVVAENMAAWVLASAILEQFGGDTMEELRERVAAHRERAARWLL